MDQDQILYSQINHADKMNAGCYEIEVITFNQYNLMQQLLIISTNNLKLDMIKC